MVRRFSKKRIENLSPIRKEVILVVKDLVCGMEINPQSAAGKSEYQGQTYYFCSNGCKKAFDKEPQKYVRTQGHSSEHVHHH
jgi:Cu+-exporting ATPase